MYDIIIPSNKPIDLLRLYVSAMRKYDTTEKNYIPTGFNVSASVNRNLGLHEARKTDNEYVIMVDDDISGFYKGWQKDLCAPLEDPNVQISSARLVNADGELAMMMGVPALMDTDYLTLKPIDIHGRVFPAVLSAAIAFRKKDVTDINFDYSFIGSGYEDTHFCWQMFKKFKEDFHIVVNNKCVLIHSNEMKQQSTYTEHNRHVFTRLTA
jgi:hypothetical protein